MSEELKAKAVEALHAHDQGHGLSYEAAFDIVSAALQPSPSVERMREALEPFARLMADFEKYGIWNDLGDDYHIAGRIRRARDIEDPPAVTVGDFRRALSAYSNPVRWEEAAKAERASIVAWLRSPYEKGSEEGVNWAETFADLIEEGRGIPAPPAALTEETRDVR